MITVFENIWKNRFNSEVCFPEQNFFERITACYEFEFYLTERGSSVIDNTEYMHKKGLLLLIKPGQKRLSKGTFICDAAHFSCTDGFFREDILEKLPTVCYLPDAADIFRTLTETHFTNTVASELHFASAIMNVLSLITEAYPITDNTVTPANMLCVKQAADYIKSHWQEPLSTQNLYKNQYISRSAFFASFKAITGYTPGQYCNIVKIEHAKHMLSATNKSIAQIAQECSFCSQAYFDYVFKLNTGKTPLQYRKANIAELFF